LSSGSVTEDEEARAPAFTEGDEGESVSRRDRELIELSIRGSPSVGNALEPVFGSSVGGGDGEVRDCSESEAPNNARVSAFFLRVTLEESGSAEDLATTSVLVLDSLGLVESLDRGACMLSTTESRRALAFNALSGDVGRDASAALKKSLRSVVTSDD
jgi:hypothetical protein